MPGWDALHLPWRSAEFLVLDLETTGLDLRRDAVVSYGAVPVRQGRVVVSERVYGLVRPPGGRTAGRAVTVHGLRAADLDGAPGPLECGRVLAGLLPGRVLVAHASWVEESFVDRLLRPTGHRLRGPVVCTAALARHLGEAPSRGTAEPGLEELARRLGLPVHTPHHALGDALTTATVLLALLARLPGDGTTVRDLVGITAGSSLHR